MRPAVHPGDDVIDRGAARGVRQAIPAPRAAPVRQLRQFGHERQAVRCPRHNLAVRLPRTGPGAERPAAEPLPGRHRQPAHTAPARLRQHEVKLTGHSDITAAADQSGRTPRRPARQRDLRMPTPRQATLRVACAHEPPIRAASGAWSSPAEARRFGRPAETSHRAGRGPSMPSRVRAARQVCAWPPGKGSRYLLRRHRDGLTIGRVARRCRLAAGRGARC